MCARDYIHWWDRLWSDPEVVKAWSDPLPEVIEFAARMRGEGRRNVCDLGSGPGRHVVYLAREGFEVTGLDNSPRAVALCREWLERERLEARVELADMCRLPLEPASVDWILAFFVIHHATAPEMERTFRGAMEVLRPGGWLQFNLLRYDPANPPKGIEIESRTFVEQEDRWEGIHHYATREECLRFISPLTPFRITESPTHYYVEAQKGEA